MHPEAVILDGEQKSALAAARALRARGVRVTVGAERKTAMALHSRAAAHRFLYPSPLQEPELFLNCVLEACSFIPKKPVLFTASDATALLISRNRARVLKHARVLLPSEEHLETAFDKARTMQLARKLGIAIPNTYFLESRKEVEGFARAAPSPAVIKPRHSAVWHRGAGIRSAVTFAHSPEEFLKRMASVGRATGEIPIVEEYVHGGEYGVEVCALHGEVKVMCAHRRIRSLSPTGGASVVKETIKIPSDLREITIKLMRELSWSGVAMVECKRDKKRDNQALLLEINGRFWGSLPLAIEAGVDFPYLYFKAARGERLEGYDVFSSCTPGIVTRHLLGDVKHLLMVLFARDPMRAHAYPSRLSAIRDFLIQPKGTRYDVISRQDPKPALMEIVDRLLH